MTAPASTEARAPLLEPTRFAEIELLLLNCARSLDDNRFEDWPDFFAEDGCYQVLSRENVERGLHAPIIYHYSRNMLKDRVMALREALTYEPTYSRHIVSNIVVLDEREGSLTVTSNYVVYQSTEEGRTRLFSVGRCVDEISWVGGRAQIKQRSVIADTFAIPNNLAVPI